MADPLVNALLGLAKERTKASRDRRVPVPAKARVSLSLTGIKPTSVKWLWKDHIPLGKLSLIDGDPGQGKSAVTLDLAARISTGSRMPDGTIGIRGNVVIMNAEDDLSDSIVPRLMRAGADLTRIHSVKLIPDKDGHERLPGIPEDLDWIATAIKRTSAKLVIIDPFFAYLSAGNASWGAMRRSLGPLANLAAETGSAIILVRHLTKALGQSNPLYRGGGSMAIAGSVRSAMLVARDPADNRQSFLIHLKSNLAAFPQTLPFRREPVRGTVRIKWGKPIDLTAEEFFAQNDAAIQLAQILRDAEEASSSRKGKGKIISGKA